MERSEWSDDEPFAFRQPLPPEDRVWRHPSELGESSVIVAVSAPHRAEAFEAARFGIDTLKETVPIWKQETWDGGEDWALGAHDLTDAASARVQRHEAG